MAKLVPMDGPTRAQQSQRQVPDNPVFEPTGPPTHVAFADEANWNKGQFRAVASVSCPMELESDYTASLRAVLDQHGVGELKWKEVNGDKKATAAAAAIDWFLERADEDRLRVDVLIWEVADPIHQRKRRQDPQNLEVKYFHHVRTLMRFRWPQNSILRLIPDHMAELNWKRLQWFLVEEGANRLKRYQSNAIQEHRIYQPFSIESIQPGHSHEHPLIQLADLFAGMAVFSYEQFDRLDQWATQAAGDPPMTLTNKERVRFPLLRLVYEWCDDEGLLVILPEYGGLRSMVPILPLNFWLWDSPGERQILVDSAAKRKRKG